MFVRPSVGHTRVEFPRYANIRTEIKQKSIDKVKSYCYSETAIQRLVYEQIASTHLILISELSQNCFLER